MSTTCEHLDRVQDVTPSANGCCDSSPNRHATAHWHAHGDHPLVRSFEPGEELWWCYADDLASEVPGADPAPSYR